MHYEKFNNLPSLLDSAYFYLEGFPEETYLPYWIYYYYLKKDYFKVTELAGKNKGDTITDAAMHYQIGQSYQNTGVLLKAIEEYRLAVKYMPFNLDYLNKLGSAYLTDNSQDKAKAVFEKMLELNPERTDALNNLGFTYLLDQDIARAEKYFREALGYDPKYLNANLNLVKIYLIKNDIFKAQQLISMLESWYPGNADVGKLKAMMK